MVRGITIFARSVSEIAEEKIFADPAVSKRWQELSERFRLVFADLEAAFRTMRFDALLADPEIAAERLGQLERDPASIGALHGGDEIFAGKVDREDRRDAEANVPGRSRLTAPAGSLDRFSSRRGDIGEIGRFRHRCRRYWRHGWSGNPHTPATCPRASSF